MLSCPSTAPHGTDESIHTSPSSRHWVAPHLQRVRTQHPRRRCDEVPDKHGKARQAQEEKPWRAVPDDCVQDILEEKGPASEQGKHNNNKGPKPKGRGEAAP